MAAPKNATPAQIINRLRKAEVQLANGKSVKEDEEALREDVLNLARRFGPYGYRMITGMFMAGGWRVNHKGVERIWRQEGLEVSKKQPKRSRAWLNDGSCIRLQPLYRQHFWPHDFVADRFPRVWIRLRNPASEHRQRGPLK